MSTKPTVTPAQWNRVREMAYQKYLARGNVDGYDVEDWLTAEEESLHSHSEVEDEIVAEENFVAEGNPVSDLAEESWGLGVSTTAGEHPILFDTYKHSAKPPEGPNSTWNGFKEIVPKSRIDFVFTTKAVNVLRLRTLDDQKNGRFPSDHLPVVVELEVKSK